MSTRFFSCLVLSALIFTLAAAGTGAAAADDSLRHGDELATLVQREPTPSELDWVGRTGALQEIELLESGLEDVEGFGGLWISWSPLKVHVRGTEESWNDLEAQISAFPYAQLIQRHDTHVTLEHLMATLDAVVARRGTAGVPRFDAELDIPGQRLVLTVEPRDESRLARILDADPIHWDAAGDAQASGSEYAVSEYLEIRTGALSEPASYNGGRALGTCTAGFVLRSKLDHQRFALLSAGHGTCGEPRTYAGYTTSPTLIRVRDATDRSVHRMPAGSPTPRNRIDISAHPWSRTITMVSSSHTVGSPVCKEGRVSGHNCGTIASNTVSPSWVTNGHSFVRSSNSCSLGDSGGPVYHDSWAKGITAGRNTSNGNCIYGRIKDQLPSDWLIKTS